MTEITVASVNCQGLGDFGKRRDVFQYLKQKRCSIYFLQDTHLNPKLDQHYSAEWGYTSLFASYNTNSRGVAILFNNNFEFKIKQVYKENDGNFLMVHIYTMNMDVLLVNIYGPNRDDPDFYVRLNEKVKQLKVANIIIAGDWNLVLNPVLDYHNYKHVHNTRAREKVGKIIEDNCLIDIWRDLNPELQRFTWRRSNPLQQSRLDFFLVSEQTCNDISYADILPGYRTDHSLITLKMTFGEQTRKSTFWKFNSSLLKDRKYIDEINKTLERVIEQYAATPYDRHNIQTMKKEDIQFTISDQLFLDVLLMEIRSKTIAYSSAKKKLDTELETKLENEIAFIEKKMNKDQNDEKLLKDKNEKLQDLRQKKMEGVLLRSRARWVGEGEKITKYFCGLEKRNYVSKHMTKLVGNNGIVLEKNTDIVREAEHFFKKLYEKKEQADCNIEEMIHDIPTLTEDEATNLEGQITLEEATLALKKMNNSKSPGSDGFTAEFFKFFWEKGLGAFVVRSINDGFNKGEMSNTQKEGIVVCLPKGDKPREYLKNWRPISLLNVVYKIGTTCIANRLKTVLPKLINEDQSGFMADRYMGNNIRLIYDIINHCNKHNVRGLLLGIDFEKAFDSLDWTFMHNVLQAFGFHEDIQRWIKVFYQNIKSCILVNGQISNWFQIKRGCRQGDPISPYLFILCAEILAIMIRENADIKGIKIGETEYKISQFADDTELFLGGDRKSFEQTINILDVFGEKSGLRLSIEKTFVVWLGNIPNQEVTYMPHLNFCWNPPKFKILGIWFAGDLESCTRLNFDAKLQEVRTLINIWMKRCLTPLGRIAVAKSLLLSKLVHLWMLLPNPPGNYMNDLQNMLFSFVWKKKRDRISRATLVKDVKDGGLGLPDIRIFMNSLKLTWIRKIFNCNHKWKNLLLHNYPSINDIKLYGPNPARIRS